MYAQKVIFTKCNGLSCNLVTKNETVRVKKDFVLQIDLIYFCLICISPERPSHTSEL